MELLLNDSWAKGEFVYPEKIHSEEGGKNTKLAAKQDYEFLLRAVQKYPLKVIGSGSRYSEIPEDDMDSAWEDFCTDCYVAGRYCQELQDSGDFALVMETLLSAASDLPDPNTAVEWLEFLRTQCLHQKIDS